MWDFASIVDRARRAAAVVSQLEEELARDPNSVSIQINLAASKKRALQASADLQQVANYNHFDICNYRLIPVYNRGFRISSVSKSLLEYQNLFSQIYDSRKNGKKNRAQIGSKSEETSALEIAYTYSGSLGFVMFAHNERDFFNGELDGSIDAFYDVISVRTIDNMRSVAQEFGRAVVKRLYDWSQANVSGGFSTDMRWSRSDGRERGELCEVDRMQRIMEITLLTSDEETEVNNHAGILVGGDITNRTFHFVVPGGDNFQGVMGEEFSKDTELRLGCRYFALIRETTSVLYATGNENKKYELLSLRELTPSIASAS